MLWGGFMSKMNVPPVFDHLQYAVCCKWSNTRDREGLETRLSHHYVARMGVSCPKWMCLLHGENQSDEWSFFISWTLLGYTSPRNLTRFCQIIFSCERVESGGETGRHYVVTVMYTCCSVFVCESDWNRLEFNSLHLIKCYLKKKLFDGSLSRSSGYRQQGDLPQIERESSLVSVNSSCCCWNWKQRRHKSVRKTMPAW